MRARIIFQVLAVLSLLCAHTLSSHSQALDRHDGGIIRGPKSSKTISLVFTGHEFAESGDTIVTELARHKAKASFFVTGDFLANTNHHSLVRRIINDRHYLGPHSDKHLLYCPWDGPKKTLVTPEGFRRDLESNLKKIESFGIQRNQIRYFLPPFEHYNEEIVRWSKDLRLILINHTPGTRSGADYTGEADKNFVPSQIIFESILTKEQKDANGLNGFILLLHIGSGPGRTDKFHARFGDLLDSLAGKGYHFARVDDLLRESATTNE